MKPLKLEMTAFGSYAEKTSIPFFKMNHGLYLIAGDTGAGKTTIFDAIVFALYGVASGSDRVADMLHCDYVPKSVDTVVDLDFMQGGKMYSVQRTIHFSKKRGSDGEYGPAKVEAVLREPDREPMEGATKVTSRVTEILGLDANQFRKIIMLAQGEFIQFLKSDSDKKMEILSKLFDNSEYLYYQNLFIKARDELKSRRADKSSELETLMSSVFMRPEILGQDSIGRESTALEIAGQESAGQEGTDPYGFARGGVLQDGALCSEELYLAGNPDLTKNIASLVEREQAELEELSRGREALNQEITRLNTALGAAEAVNAQFDDLAKQENILAGLAASEEGFRQREGTLGRVELAVRKVKPAEDRYENAARSLSRIRTEIGQLTEELKTLKEGLGSAEAAVKADESVQKEIDALTVQGDILEGQIPKYTEINKKLSEKKDLDEEVSKAAARKGIAEETLQKEKDYLAALKARVKELEGIDARVESLSSEHRSVKEKYGILAGTDGVKADIAGIRAQEARLDSGISELKRLTEEAAAASDRYNELYKLFIAGQAGLIASELRTELEHCDSADCPVCGSTVERKDLGRLAVLPEETPEEDDVAAARDHYDDKEKQRSEKNASVSSLKTAIESSKENAVRRAKTVLQDCADWDELVSEGYLADAIADLERRERDLAARLQEAAKLKAERDTSADEIDKKEGSTEKLASLIADLTSEVQDKSARSREIEAAVREMKSPLKYETEQEAKSALSEIRGDCETKKAAIRQNADRLKAIKESFDLRKGTLEEKENSVEGLNADLEDAKAAMDKQIAECGFAGREEAARFRALTGATDGEVWIKQEQQAITKYKGDVLAAKTQVDSLKARLAGKEYTDTGALDAEIGERNARQREFDALHSRRKAMLDNHRDVGAKAKAILENLSTTEGAWKRIQKLAELAEGASGAGGKLSFERYVMGAVFKEIIDMANRRMEQMSGGKYELVHKVAADRKNARAGLEIEVLDNNTGQLRKSDSLSGGEKFFTSLALALGLSDVVQNHAGGKQMEALFIDEGFGSLSDDILDRALGVLEQLTTGDRLVGIISHVDKLDESIPQKIMVRNSEHGSSIEMIVS